MAPTASTNYDLLMPPQRYGSPINEPDRRGIGGSYAGIDLPLGTGSNDWDAEPGSLPPFFAESGINCNQWSSMSESARTETMRSWLRRRAIRRFNIYGALGFVDAATNIILADNACDRYRPPPANQDRERSRAAAAEAAEIARRDAAQRAAAAAAPYARTPQGRAGIMLGRIGMTCQTWQTGSKDPAVRSRIVQIALRTSEAEADEIRDLIDHACSGFYDPVFAVAKSAIKPSGSIQTSMPWIGGVLAGGLLTYLAARRSGKRRRR